MKHLQSFCLLFNFLNLQSSSLLLRDQWNEQFEAIGVTM